MPSRESGFSHLLDPSLRDIFFNKFKLWPKEYPAVFNTLTSTRAYEEDAEVAALGKMIQKPEGTSIAYDDPFQSTNRKRYTFVSYGLGFRVSHELYNDDQYGIIKRMPEALSRSANQTEEVDSWQVFNNAFNTAFTGIDGQPLISTAHPNIRGLGSGPYSNRLATDADLSVTSLQAAVELMENTTDDRDINIMVKPTMLVIPVHLKWMARELLNSEYKPHTGDNEINALADEDLKYMVSHYLSSSSAWFLMAAKDQHYLKHYQREKLTFDSDDDFDTGDAKFKAFERFKADFTNWRGIVGTPGVGLL